MGETSDPAKAILHQLAANQPQTREPGKMGGEVHLPAADHGLSKPG